MGTCSNESNAVALQREWEGAAMERQNRSATASLFIFPYFFIFVVVTSDIKMLILKHVKPKNYMDTAHSAVTITRITSAPQTKVFA